MCGAAMLAKGSGAAANGVVGIAALRKSLKLGPRASTAAGTGTGAAAEAGGAADPGTATARGCVQTLGHADALWPGMLHISQAGRRRLALCARRGRRLSLGPTDPVGRAASRTSARQRLAVSSSRDIGAECDGALSGSIRVRERCGTRGR